MRLGAERTYDATRRDVAGCPPGKGGEVGDTVHGSVGESTTTEGKAER
jgi:hypothetical protein